MTKNDDDAVHAAKQIRQMSELEGKINQEQKSKNIAISLFLGVIGLVVVVIILLFMAGVFG